MTGFNPLKKMINKIPVPQTKLTEVLRIEGMSKIFKQKAHEVNALKNVHCTIYQGEMVAIMGTSGSGKSTLLNMISAIDEPTSGTIFLFGEEANAIYKEPKASNFRKENIGFIFQAFHLLKDLNVEDNIALPLILNDVPSKEVKELVDEMMRELGIYNWRKHRPNELSGGQKQRVAIARAMIAKPPILLADEPTGALDVNTTDDILKLLVEIQQRGQTILLVTHDPYVATYANRVLFFHDGAIVDSYQNEQSKQDLDAILAKFKLISRGER
ncbi:ABC transporter ATP-binding protein [Metasolibacillus meyeri]|uniref:ABC transporter ATP-binding protein n=2 Tax=Metasolibacillus meyeri TaxID=1071052 RepID=A0AAW9NVI4_9BACL|nr:ABC transporter ATP-binding protein [Metasolibacillus meyeri]MEC1180591.1 ABC transporter ATP-binding protein [Metasolibacillus meyeri]